MTYPKEHNSYEADVPQPTQDGISDRAIHNGNTRPTSNDWSYYSDQSPAPPQSGGALRGFLFGMVSMALLGLVGIGWFLFARRPPQEAAVSPSTSESEAVETIPDGADSEGIVPEETVPEAASSEADAQSAIGSDAQPSQASRSNLPPAPAVDLQINHPNGSTAQLTGLTFTDNSIVADLTVTNGYKNPIELNRVDSMVIVDSAGNQYNLAAPPNNEEVRIDPGTTLEGRFVFSGHLAPGVTSLSVITNSKFGGNESFTTDPKFVFQVDMPGETP